MLYVKDNKGVLEDSENRFIYEVAVYLSYKNVFSMVKNKLYASTKEIENIVECFRLNKYISIYCDLYAAPKEWLISNEFIPYVKKPKNEKQKEVPNKRGGRKTTDKTTTT
jgi:hypothetical protein